MIDESGLIAEIRDLQILRKFYIKQNTRAVNSARALVRLFLGFDANDDEKTRADIVKRASGIFAAVRDGKAVPQGDAEIAAKLAPNLHDFIESMAITEKRLESIVKDMQKAAKKLAVYPWAKNVLGFGELGLAVIVGECGDLADYPKKGHLWKRLGLAPYRGHAMSSWRGGVDGEKLSADEWSECGYSPDRRSQMFSVIADPLLRAQTSCAEPYRQVYELRRANAFIAHPDWTDMHLHLDAMRVMTKILLRDLRTEWIRCRAIVPVTSNGSVPNCPTPYPIGTTYVTAGDYTMPFFNGRIIGPAVKNTNLIAAE